MHKQKSLTIIAVFIGVLVLLLMNQSEGFVTKSITPSTTTPPAPTKGWDQLGPDGKPLSGNDPMKILRCSAYPQRAECVGFVIPKRK